MLCGQYPTKSEGKELKIMVQPETQHRARYLTEGSRGSVKDRTQQGFPTVKVGWGPGHCLPGLPQGQGSFSALGREQTVQSLGWRGCTGSLPAGHESYWHHGVTGEESCRSGQGCKIWDAHPVRLQFHGLCEYRDIPNLGKWDSEML